MNLRRRDTSRHSRHNRPTLRTPRAARPLPREYRGSGNSGGLTHGGINNPSTGLGGAGDKSQTSFFTPTRIHWRGELEVIYNESWACSKFIDIPVDDMLARWRVWDSAENEQAADLMLEADQRHKVRQRIGDAMKAGRLFGTGLLVMVSREAPLHAPLMPEQLRPGDLLNLLVFDRYDASVFSRDDDFYSDTYGEALSYWISPTRGPGFQVHHTRCLRFDGRKPLSSDGYTIYDRDWGVSEVIPVITSILQDASAASGAAHMTQEASLPVLRVDGLRDALVGQRDPSEPSPEDIGGAINSMKSIFRLMMLDKTEEFDRIAVNFGGMDGLLDRFNRRLAAAADIPATRFWGSSPVGMNATGESDMANYSQSVASRRTRMLPTQLHRLDQVLAMDAGVMEPPVYEWPPLMEEPESEQANAAHVRVQALALAVQSGAIDEDEMRASLDGTPIFGELAGDAPGLPEPEPVPEPTGGQGGN